MNIRPNAILHFKRRVGRPVLHFFAALEQSQDKRKRQRKGTSPVAISDRTLLLRTRTHLHRIEEN